MDDTRVMSHDAGESLDLTCSDGRSKFWPSSPTGRPEGFRGLLTSLRPSARLSPHKPMCFRRSGDSKNRPQVCI